MADTGDGVANGCGCQTTAFIEGTVTNTGDRVRDGDGGQPVATIEGIIGDLSHIVTNIQCGQVCAIIKNRIVDSTHGCTIGGIEIDRCQRAASRKCSIPNTGDGTADGYGSQSTASEGIVSNAGDGIWNGERS